MKNRLIKGLLALIVLVLVASAWFFLSQHRLHGQLGRFAEELLRLHGLEVGLDRDMERVTAFHTINFDAVAGLEKTLLAQEHATEQLAQKLFSSKEPVFFWLSAYLKALEKKRDLLSRMQQHAAVVRNSLLYLLTLVTSKEQKKNDSHALLHDLYDRLLMVPLFPNPEAMEELEWALQQQIQDGINPNAMRHMLVSVRHLSVMTRMMREFQEVNSHVRFQQLTSAFERYRKRQNNEAIAIGGGLLGLVLLLLLWLIKSLSRLEKVQHELANAHQQLQDAVESLNEGFALFDGDGRLRLYNTAFLRLYPWVEPLVRKGAWLDQLDEAIRKRVRLRRVDGAVLAGEEHSPHGGTYLEDTEDDNWYLAHNRQIGDGSVVWTRTDITKTRADQSELRKLSRAMEQSPVSVLITDIDGIIEYVNPKFTQVSGYSAEEVIGAKPSLLKSGDMNEAEYADMWETILSGRVWEGVFHNKRKDGSLYWESARIAPVKDDFGEITHFIGIKEDITELRRYQESLRLSGVVFDATSEGIVLTDARGCVRMVNPAFTRITGYEPEEVLEQPVSRFLGEDNQETVARVLAEMEESDNWSGEVTSHRKDGSWYHQWLSITTLHDEKGVANGHVIIFSDITQHKADQARILFQANYDVLTGLPNRALLSDRLHQALRVARRHETGVAVAFVDLDRFKAINDLYGHVIGDELLEQVADRLRLAVRETDTVARFGGDEFVVLLEGLGGGDMAAVVADKIITAVSQPYSVRGRRLTVGCSIGITLYPHDVPLALPVDEAATRLLSNADMAMYQAKSKGRNQYQFFEQKTQQEVRYNLALEQDMRRALEKGEFELHYQPIIDAAENRIESVEALVRWRHPKRGIIPPDQFIPLAEETGLIYEIGNWVIQTATREVKRWHDEEDFPIGVSVNVSARQRERGFGVQKLKEMLGESGLAPEYFTMEITENLLMLNSEEVVSCMRGMKELGVSLSVDDFGTGYSSLGYLKQFPVDLLKIDRAFIRDLPEDRESVSLVKAIIAMARSLGIEVVAEGVETEAQRRFLVNLGCQYLQGYHFDRPLPAEEIVRKYAPDFNDRPIRSVPG